MTYAEAVEAVEEILVAVQALEGASFEGCGQRLEEAEYRLRSVLRDLKAEAFDEQRAPRGDR